MMATDEMSEDQSYYSSSWGEHECFYRISWQSNDSDIDPEYKIITKTNRSNWNMFVHLWHLNKPFIYLFIKIFCFSSKYFNFVSKSVDLTQKCTTLFSEYHHFSYYFFYIWNITTLFDFILKNYFSSWQLLLLEENTQTVVYLSFFVILSDTIWFNHQCQLICLYPLKILNFINIYWSQSTNQFILIKLPMQVVRDDLCVSQ